MVLCPLAFMKDCQHDGEKEKKNTYKCYEQLELERYLKRKIICRLVHEVQNIN